MTTETVKKALNQVYYEEVEELKAAGAKNSEAIRAVAERHGKTENAIRGGLRQYKVKQDSSNGASPTATVRRRKGLGVDDHLENARVALRSALALIDDEVNTTEAALSAAQARYDEVRDSVEDRKRGIEAKLAALEAE